MSTLNGNILLPGDALIYRPSNLVGYIIALKTWTWASHIEIYIGDLQSIAARPSGVNIYPIRYDKYTTHVLRPKKKLNVKKAMDWFHTEAMNDKYDYIGLFDFFSYKDGKLSPKAEVCSVLASLWYNQAGFYPFSKDYPINKISPAQFLQSNAFHIIWKK
jgi:uncharacterized protein YycO